MAEQHDRASAALLETVEEHGRCHGAEILESHETACEGLVGWLDYLRTSQLTDTADALLDGLHAALIESAGCLSLGLVRPAVFSMRAQIDLLLAWLFFKDHAVEWQFVEEKGQKYRLPSEVLKYLRTFYPRFESRMQLLRRRRTNGNEDPYSVLSAHVHGQNTATVPRLGELPLLVRERADVDECVALQAAVSEYLSDLLVACFAREWLDLPESVRLQCETRLSAAELEELCRA